MVNDQVSVSVSIKEPIHVVTNETPFDLVEDPIHVATNELNPFTITKTNALDVQNWKNISNKMAWQKKINLYQ
jgi:hypothetical protein